MVARIFSLDEKKALNRLKAFKCMVGRERFERSTSGLKVLQSFKPLIIIFIYLLSV
jgi:hypothetical protein